MLENREEFFKPAPAYATDATGHDMKSWVNNCRSYARQTYHLCFLLRSRKLGYAYLSFSNQRFFTETKVICVSPELFSPLQRTLAISQGF